MTDLDPRQAAAEILRRQRARASLVEFSQAIDVPGVPQIETPDEFDAKGHIIETIRPQYAPIESRVALHHLLMMQAIQRCIETPRGRLMIFAPPGSAKVYLCFSTCAGLGNGPQAEHSDYPCFLRNLNRRKAEPKGTNDLPRSALHQPVAGQTDATRRSKSD